MDNKEKKMPSFNKTILVTVGIVAIFLLAIALLWHGNANSMQAVPAMTAGVYFDGEYRIADGDWQTIVKGKHIPSTQGDVTLRGNFHMMAPDGEYAGIYDSETPIALYTDHINLKIYEGENEPYVIDTENPLYGDSVCGVIWTAYSVISEEVVEIVIHNPHSFGNETAIDELLANMAIWTGIEFEKGVMEQEEAQRDIGHLFIIISLLFLGTALFSTLIHIKSSKIIWLFGIVIVFAGTYFIYSVDGISLWYDSVVSNTTMLGVSMMFYMLFLMIALTHFLKTTKTVGTIAVIILGILDALCLAMPIMTKTYFYDTWLYWIVGQSFANIVLFGCYIREFIATKEKERWLYIGAILPLISFGVDVFMVDFGLWNNAIASKYVFVIFFVAAIFVVLRIIPNSINAVAKAKKLETEKIALNAQLTESRVSTMMSQIRPHFI